MTKKVYRTAQGKSVDLGALQLQNETVRAVGNMGVNARGDRISPQNITVDSRNTRVGKQYKKQVSNVVDDYVPVSKHDIQVDRNTRADTPVDIEFEKQDKVQKQQKVEKSKTKEKNNTQVKSQSIKPSETELVVEPTRATESNPVKEDPIVKKSESLPSGGLASAIARARTVKQEPLKTPRELSKSQSGVKKI